MAGAEVAPKSHVSTSKKLVPVFITSELVPSNISVYHRFSKLTM